MSLSPDYLFLKLQALTLLVFGQRSAARAKFEQMLAIAPNDRYALASHAHVLAEMGDKPAAIRALQALVAAHPGQSAAWFNLAYLQEEAGRHAEAEDAFRRAIEIEPKMDRAWYGLALVLIHDRRFDEAIEALKRNTELQPMSPYGWYQLRGFMWTGTSPMRRRRSFATSAGSSPKWPPSWNARPDCALRRPRDPAERALRRRGICPAARDAIRLQAVVETAIVECPRGFCSWR